MGLCEVYYFIERLRYSDSSEYRNLSYHGVISGRFV